MGKIFYFNFSERNKNIIKEIKDEIPNIKMHKLELGFSKKISFNTLKNVIFPKKILSEKSNFENREIIIIAPIIFGGIPKQITKKLSELEEQKFIYFLLSGIESKKEEVLHKYDKEKLKHEILGIEIINREDTKIECKKKYKNILQNN